MEKSRRPRWLKWVLWTPIVLALLGFGAMVVAERRIDSEIEREVAELLKMGVDVRPITPERDAGPDYERLAETLKKEINKPGISEQTLAALETASQKPLVTLGKTNGRIEGVEFELPWWIGAKYRESSAKRDFATMNRLLALTKAFEAQVEGGNTNRPTFYSRFGVLESWILGEHDLNVLAWHRKELEKFDFERLFRAQLSSVGRQLRFRPSGEDETSPGAYVVRPSLSPPKSSWEKAVESQVMFRKASELTALRNLRKVSEAILQIPPQSAANLNIESMVASELDRENTWQARVAKESLDRGVVLMWGSGAFPGDIAGNTNLALIKIDLLESRAKNLPLVPTWSKKYCFDADGSPLRVTATKSGFEIKSKHMSYAGSW